MINQATKWVQCQVCPPSFGLRQQVTRKQTHRCAKHCTLHHRQLFFVADLVPHPENTITFVLAPERCAAICCDATPANLVSTGSRSCTDMCAPHPAKSCWSVFFLKKSRTQNYKRILVEINPFFFPSPSLPPWIKLSHLTQQPNNSFCTHCIKFVGEFVGCFCNTQCQSHISLWILYELCPLLTILVHLCSYSTVRVHSSFLHVLVRASERTLVEFYLLLTTTY